jgi:hypothetical protein
VRPKMSEKIDADLFARLMGLPLPARTDLLEFLGETLVEGEELERFLEDMAARDYQLTVKKPLS